MPRTGSVGRPLGLPTRSRVRVEKSVSSRRRGLPILPPRWIVTKLRSVSTRITNSLLPKVFASIRPRAISLTLAATSLPGCQRPPIPSYSQTPCNRNLKTSLGPQTSQSYRQLFRHQPICQNSQSYRSSPHLSILPTKIVPTHQPSGTSKRPSFQVEQQHGHIRRGDAADPTRLSHAHRPKLRQLLLGLGS